MSKHTPGPWTYYPDDNIIVSKSGYRLLDWIARSTAVSIDERNANARLIAAAPENYACNIELAKIVRELCGIYGHPLPEASLERSDAAINKATGE